MANSHQIHEPRGSYLRRIDGGDSFLRVLLDCDGILGDFAGEVVRFCNLYGREPGEREFTVDEVDSFDILEALGCEDQQDELDTHMQASDFCEVCRCTRAPFGSWTKSKTPTTRWWS